MFNTNNKLIYPALLIFSIGLHSIIAQIPPADFVEQAKTEIDRINYANARRLLEDGIKQEPKNKKAILLLLDLNQREKKEEKEIEILQHLVVYFPEEEYSQRHIQIFELGFKLVTKRIKPGFEKESLADLNRLALFKGYTHNKAPDLTVWKKSWLPLATISLQKQDKLSPEERQIIDIATTPIVLDHLYHLRKEKPQLANQLIEALKREKKSLVDTISNASSSEWPFISMTISSLEVDSLSAINDETTRILILPNTVANVNWNSVPNCPLCAITLLPYEQALKNFNEDIGSQWERAATFFHSGQQIQSVQKLKDFCVQKVIETNPTSDISKNRVCPQLDEKLSLAESNFTRFVVSDPLEVNRFLKDLSTSIETYNCKNMEERIKALITRSQVELPIAAEYREIQYQCNELQKSSSISKRTKAYRRLNLLKDRFTTSSLKSEFDLLRTTEGERIQSYCRESAIDVINKYFNNMNNDEVLRTMWQSLSTPDPIIVSNLISFNVDNIIFKDDLSQALATVDISFSSENINTNGRLEIDLSPRDSTWIITDIKSQIN